MAKINVEYDTKEKTLKCSHDGKEMCDIMEASFWAETDHKGKVQGHRARISSMKHDGEHDTRHVQHMVASEDGALVWQLGSAADKEVASEADIAGLCESLLKVRADITEYLTRG